MSTTVVTNVRFESAHFLPHVPPDHKCARLHGHSFRVTVRVGGDLHPELGWIVDFADIDKAWQPLHEILDHRYLNEIEGLENPTSEILARFIFERLELSGGHLVSITVHETCAASCTVYADH